MEMENSLLQSKGHDTRILYFDNSSIRSVFSKIKTGIQSFYNTNSSQILKRQVNAFQPDIIHIHNLFFKASPSILYQAFQLKVPVIVTVQNYRLICSNALLLRNDEVCELCIHHKFPISGIKYKCYRSSAVESALVTGITGVHKVLNTWDNKINTVIVPSHFMKNKLSDSSLNVAAGKIVVKQNFIHDKAAMPEERNNFFLFIGRLSIEKGINTLIDCFKKNTDLKLIIAGEGPEKERIEALCKVTPSISYIGHQPKDAILSLMRRCQALVFPSIWYEGLPLTIIEAFSTGTPVIASRLGAMSEMIVDDYNGLHFTAKNVDELENCLRRINSSEEMRQKLGRQARLTYEEKFHPEVHYKSIMSIYKNAIESNRNL